MYTHHVLFSANVKEVQKAINSQRQKVTQREKNKNVFIMKVSMVMGLSNSQQSFNVSQSLSHTDGERMGVKVKK